MQQNAAGVTTRDVARVAGVSVGTVNRVLNNLPNVGDALRDRVMQAVDELGYIYAPKKRATDTVERATTQHTLLFCVGASREATLQFQQTQHAYYYEILRGVEHECTIRGARLLFTQLPDHADAIEQLQESLDQQDASGVILTNYHSSTLIQRIMDMHIPVVHIDPRSPEELVTDHVTSDDLGGAKMLTRHLIGLGHREIAFINSAPQYVTQVRFDGFRAALNDAGLSCRPELTLRLPMLSIEHAQEALSNLLAHEQFTAIVCASDNAAFGSIRALYHAGIHVPHRVSVVGFDDHLTAALFNPPLTTVHAGTFEKGRIAVARLLDRIAYPDKPVEWSTIPVRLMVRSTTAPVHT